ncbi:MAG: ROK family protein [Omnitrophica bacterium]|nr:ROK family protein [Candidatus Omnitrophota bacterium]
MKEANTKEMEKRQFPRLEKTLPVKFNLPDIPEGSGVFEALSRNIGAGGVFIETDLVHDEGFALDKEKLLNLEIELLGQAKRIKPRAKIAWISKKSRTPRKTRSGIGVKFIQITAEEKRAISVFISQEMLQQAGVIEKAIPAISREHRLSDRNRRNLQILDIIRKNRLISRAEISKDTDINIVTVSNYIDTYLKKGLVFERGLDISSGGRRPELIEINPQYGYVLGVDCGSLNKMQTTMQAVVTDFTARILSNVRKKRESEENEDSVEVLKDLIDQALASSHVQVEKIRGIGLGIPGIMDKFGGTVRNPESGTAFANYVTIKKGLEEEFKLPVFIENSASCALVAEKWTGLSLEVKSADNIIYIFSEHQSAIMLKGELYTGSSKSAGQLNLAQDLEKEQKYSGPVASGTRLGAKIAGLINLLNPQVIIVGANFSRLGDVFLDTLRHSAAGLAHREALQQVRIIAATLAEEAVALGSASLVIEAAFANI